MSRFVTAAILGASLVSAGLLSGCACPPLASEGPAHHLRAPDYSLGPTFPYGWYPTYEVYSGPYDDVGFYTWPDLYP